MLLLFGHKNGHNPWETNNFRNQARASDVPRYWLASRATSGSDYFGCAHEVARKGEGKPAEA